MKKFIFAITFLLLTFQAIAKPIDNIKQFTLENGMEVYMLEDSSDALVHVKFVTKAGFSSQSQDNGGFFKLYTRLVKSSNKNLDFTAVQCNADSSNYKLDMAAPETEEILYKLSDALFEPQFSDDIFNQELSKLKQEVTSASEDMSVYINSAIDSKVFSDSPWKHDSGIYPAIFKQISTKEARNHIKNISDNWYTPQNSAIFIWGNINSEKIKIIMQNTFGRFYSANKVPKTKPLTPVNNHRKFVLHAPEISRDLTQVVVQYTTLNMEQADILGAALNNNSSQFKQNLLNQEILNIPGDEYINVSAAHQKDNSRLIIQTLIQKPENNDIKTNSAEQSQLFVNEILNIPNTLNDMAFQLGKALLLNNMETIINTPSTLMDYLSNFWAFSEYYQSSESDLEKFKNSLTTGKMMSRVNKISSTNLIETLKIFEAENPFVFVIINSKDYNVNKKLYKEMGFEEISTKEANWYVQEMYKEIKNKYNFENINPYAVTDENVHDNQYFQKNVNNIKEHTLKNGIKVVTKENPEAADMAVVLSINGGKLNSPENNGFEEVITNILASVIEREVLNKQIQGLIISPVDVSTEIKLSTSSIIIKCQKEDSVEIFNAIKNGLIYGQVPPAFADKEVGLKQYRKRLENGSAVNQMYSEVINQLYGNGDLSKVFDTSKEVLINTDYLSIIAAYPVLLDGARYNVIVTGNFDQNINQLLESSLGLLGVNNIELNTGKDILNFPSKKSAEVKITHTFLTDIPAEEAGPQPAELIPTTEFLDPVIYAIKAPEFGTKDWAVFSSMMLYFQKELENEISKNRRLENCSVSVRLPESKTNFGAIIFQNVKHTKEIDSVYKKTYEKIIKDFSSPISGKKALKEIKNLWTKKEMKKTMSTSGTALLIQEGFEQFPENPRPAYYLETYNTIQNCSIKDFEKILQYFPIIPDLRVYSTDSKK